MLCPNANRGKKRSLAAGIATNCFSGTYYFFKEKMKMKLSRKKAIELCIELWTWLAKTGKGKSEWPRWKEFGEIFSNCWFCQYDVKQCRRYKKSSSDWYCQYCPYYKKYGRCDAINSLYSNWGKEQRGTEARKIYAKLFLKQIKKCK